MLAVALLLFAQAATPVDLATLRYVDIKLGEGAPATPGQRYTVHYTGFLKDGKTFDSSVNRNEPFSFVQGRRQVIAGWEAGFEGMRVGGKRRLIIPYQFAYGEKGRDPIPPKAELTFDVELLKVENVPEIPAAADILLAFGDLESKVMQLAKAVPEEKYKWRPMETARSFGEVFLHIAHGNQLLLNISSEDLTGDALERQIETNSKNEKQPVTKEAVLRTLQGSFAEVRKSLETTRAGALGRDVSFFGKPATTRAVLVFLDVHMAEHTGQAIAYARMNGIIPPWSK